MRAVFLLLVLANLAFLAWTQSRLGGQEEGREPERLQQQLHPDRIEVGVQPPQACRRIEALPLAEAERLRQALETAGLRSRLLLKEEKPAFWVHIPAFPTAAAAERKAAELRALGINDFHVVQENGGFAVSLGVFDEEGAARDFLQQMGTKGVKSARLETKTKAATVASVEVSGAADVVATRLSEAAGRAAGAAVECP